ncbi:MAG: hypothetical protein MK074_01555 [Phycisphaerales bacterium]|nr:hypothetical protein [Phycisphaerales bacterium]
MFKRIAAAATLALSCTASVLAQGGLEAIPALMRPEFFSRDLLLFIEGLELSAEQQVIVELAFEDYEADFNAGIESMNAKITAIAEDVEALRNDEDQLLATVLAPIQEWAIEREVLNDQLLENVRVLLDADQQARWSAFARQLYREKNLPHGRLSGESVNLFHIVRDQQLEPWQGTPLEPMLVQYDADIDRALRQRFAQSLVQPGSGFVEVIRKREAGSAEDVDRRRKMLASRVAVRDANDMAIEQIAAALGGEEGATFRHEALKRGYGRIYRTTPAQRVFLAALECDACRDDAALRTAVQNLYDEYLGVLDDFNERLLVATRDFEPHQERTGIENSARRARGENIERVDDPTRPLYQERREMGAEFIERLKDLLSDEVFMKLDGARRFMPRAADSARGTTHEVPGAADKSGPISTGSESKPRDITSSGRGLGQQKPGGNRGDKDR